jgi:hypothetical protein
MVAEDQPWLDNDRLDAQPHPAGLSTLVLRLPRSGHAAAEGTDGRVEGPDEDRRPGSKTRRFGRLRGDLAGDLPRGPERRETLDRDRQLRRRIIVPALAADVEAVEPVRLSGSQVASPVSRAVR